MPNNREDGLEIRQDERGNLRMRQVPVRQVSVYDYSKRTVSKCAFVIFKLTTLILPISMLLMGAMYVHSCPVNNYIPVYLIVGGTIGCLDSVLRGTGISEKFRLSIVLGCFLLLWFIIGSVWIFLEYEPTYIYGTKRYCNKTLYLFALWITILEYCMMAILIVYFCAIWGSKT